VKSHKLHVPTGNAIRLVSRDESVDARWRWSVSPIELVGGCFIPVSDIPGSRHTDVRQLDRRTSDRGEPTAHYPRLAPAPQSGRFDFDRRGKSEQLRIGAL
jgi:hypothetical protein